MQCVEAAAPALGWEPGEFASTFESTRRDADLTAIEALPVGPVVLRFMEAMDDEQKWSGPASSILAELVKIATDDERREQGWPKAANRLAQQLRRLSPNLRQVGVWIGRDRSGRGRSITLEKNHDAWSRQHCQHRQASREKSRDDAAHVGDDEQATDRHQSSWDASQASLTRQQVWDESEPTNIKTPRTEAETAPTPAVHTVASDGNDDGDDPVTEASDRGVGGKSEPGPYLPHVRCESAGLCQMSGKCCFPGMCSKRAAA